MLLTSLSKTLLASPVTEATRIAREIFDLKFLKKEESYTKGNLPI